MRKKKKGKPYFPMKSMIQKAMVKKIQSLVEQLACTRDAIASFGNSGEKHRLELSTDAYKKGC
jgi:hypothetical protein